MSMPERLIPYIIPATPGTIDEILARSPQGEEKFPSLIELKRRAREDFLADVPDDEKDEYSDWFDSLHPLDERGYVLDFTPRIRPETLERILTPSVNTINLIFTALSIPQREDYISRIIAVDEDTFCKVQFQELEEDPYAHFQTLGLTLPNRLILLNTHRIDIVYKRTHVPWEALIRREALYQLVGESLTYQQVLIPEGIDPSPFADQLTIRRQGLAFADANPTTLPMTTHLQEGFAIHFTNVVLDQSGELPRTFLSPTPEADLIREIEEGLGRDILIRAAFLPEGLYNFNVKFEQRYGRGALGQIIKLMDIDCRTERYAREHTDIEYSPYQDTLSFLRGNR